MYRVVLKNSAKKQLAKLPQKPQKLISQAIDSLSEDPFTGKKLKGSLADKYSLRVWPYRIIYTIQSRKVLVTILAIGHRQGVYK